MPDHKQKQIVNILESSKADLLIVTETWIKFGFPKSLKQFNVVKSPPDPSQGTLIVAGNRITRLQPMLASIWTLNTIVIKATLVDL